MLNPQLVEFVSKQRAQGYTDDQIRQALADKGWQDADINEVFSAPAQTPFVPQSLPTISETLKQTWEIFQSKIGLYLGTSALVAVVLLLWGFMFSKNGPSPITPGSFASALVLGVVLILLSLVTQIMLFTLTTKRNQNFTFNELFNSSFPKIWGLAWTSFICGLVVLLGFIVLVIPGLYLVIATTFTSFVFLDQGIRGYAAVKKSREYVKGNWLNVLARIFVMFLVWILLTGILSAPFRGNLMIKNVLDALVNLFATPIILIYLTLIYEQLKTLKPDLAGRNA